MISLKVRIVSSIAFLLVAGIAPVIALVVEHGGRAGLFIRSGPHLFSFACSVAPIAVYVFLEPLIRLGRSCTTARKVTLLSLALVLAGSACAFDYIAGSPQLFEFDRRVQDADAYRIGGHTLWRFYEHPEKLGKQNPRLKELYTAMMRELANRGARSPTVVIPYYIAMYVLLLFAILYALALGLVICDSALRSEEVVDQLFTSGLLCLPWLPAQQAFLENKRMLYVEDATYVILPMGIGILIAVIILFGQMERERRKLALPQITFGALIVLLAVPQITDSAWQLFSRNAHPAWGVMLYIFALLFFVTRLPGLRRSPPTQRGVDRSEAHQQPSKVTRSDASGPDSVVLSAKAENPPNRAP